MAVFSFKGRVALHSLSVRVAKGTVALEPVAGINRPWEVAESACCVLATCAPMRPPPYTGSPEIRDSGIPGFFDVRVRTPSDDMATPASEDNEGERALDR